MKTTSAGADVRDFQHQEGSAPKRQKVDQADVPLSNIEASCLGNGKATAQVRMLLIRAGSLL